MRRPLAALSAGLLIVSCTSVLHERWEGDPEQSQAQRPKKKVATDKAGPPPVSFVVPPQGEEVEIAEEYEPPPPKTRPRPAADDTAEVTPSAEHRPHEIPISQESVSAPLVLRQGETDRYHEPGGQPLAGGDQFGNVTSPAAPAPPPETTSPPPARKEHYQRDHDSQPPPEVPVPAPAETTSAPAPAPDPAPAPPPPPLAKKRRAPVDSDSTPPAATEETPAATPPPEETPPPKPIEEPVRATPAPETVAETPPARPADDSAFIDVPAEKPKKKKKHRKSDDTDQADVTANTADQPKPFDPFGKMDKDMATLDGPKEPAPAEETKAAPAESESTETTAPPPPKKKHKKRPPAPASEADATQSHPRDTSEPPPGKPLQRDPKWIGFSVTGGAGVLLASGARPGFTPALAYGGQLAWNPSLLGDFGLDLGYWRSATTTGTTYEHIATTDNDFSARLFWLPQIGSGFYAGVGLGLLMTFTTSTYSLTGSPPGNAGTLLAGGDGAVTLGYRISYFEVHVDVRALLRGGARIEFLPALSLGITF